MATQDQDNHIDKFYYNYIHWKHKHEKDLMEYKEQLEKYRSFEGKTYKYTFKQKSIDEYKGKCVEGKAFQVMIDNNLCFDIALYPYELVTYGETGSAAATVISKNGTYSNVRITLSEERNRETITKLKTKYREIITKYNKNKNVK